MRCPFCSAPQTQVLETRDAERAIRRRRECPECERRFTTYERIEALPLAVRKRDGSQEAFDPDKLTRGVVRAAYPRTLDVDRLEAIADRVAEAVRAAGGELPAQRIGELVLRDLRDIDPVAYVRFASVYRNFDDVSQFQAELGRLEEAERGEARRTAAEAQRADGGREEVAPTGPGSVRP